MRHLLLLGHGILEIFILLCSVCCRTFVSWISLLNMANMAPHQVLWLENFPTAWNIAFTIFAMTSSIKAALSKTTKCFPLGSWWCPGTLYSREVIIYNTNTMKIICYFENNITNTCIQYYIHLNLILKLNYNTYRLEGAL